MYYLFSLYFLSALFSPTSIIYKFNSAPISPSRTPIKRPENVENKIIAPSAAKALRPIENNNGRADSAGALCQTRFRNPSADNEIGDVGGNKLEDTRGLRFGRKGKKGAAYEVRSKLVHAKTEQISTWWKRRSRIDFVVN